MVWMVNFSFFFATDSLLLVAIGNVMFKFDFNKFDFKKTAKGYFTDTSLLHLEARRKQNYLPLRQVSQDEQKDPCPMSI